MVFGGNTDNVKNRQRVLKERLDDGQCTFCPPHQGENYGYHGRVDRRHVGDGVFVPSKSKDRK